MLLRGCVDAGALTGASEDAVNAQSARMRALLAMLLRVLALTMRKRLVLLHTLRTG
jgi:hypothetical protein